MKARLNIKLVMVLMAALIMTNFAYAGINQNIKDWYGNQNFAFTAKNDFLNVTINKNPWEAFTLNIDNAALMSSPVVNIEVSSKQSITLRVDISDGVYISSQLKTLESKVEGNGMLYTLVFDFTEILDNVNLGKDAYLVFYVNPGQKFNGEISIKNIKFSTISSNASSNVATAKDLSVYPSPATTFTNVSLPEGNFNFLTIVDMSGKIIRKIDVTSYNGMNYNVELDGISRGNYLVQLIGNDIIMSGKLVIH